MRSFKTGGTQRQASAQTAEGGYGKTNSMQNQMDTIRPFSRSRSPSRLRQQNTGMLWAKPLSTRELLTPTKGMNFCEDSSSGLKARKQSLPVQGGRHPPPSPLPRPEGRQAQLCAQAPGQLPAQGKPGRPCAQGRRPSPEGETCCCAPGPQGAAWAPSSVWGDPPQARCRELFPDGLGKGSVN